MGAEAPANRPMKCAEGNGPPGNRLTLQECEAVTMKSSNNRAPSIGPGRRRNPGPSDTPNGVLAGNNRHRREAACRSPFQSSGLPPVTATVAPET